MKEKESKKKILLIGVLITIFIILFLFLKDQEPEPELINQKSEKKLDRYNEIAKRWNHSLRMIEKNTSDTYLSDEKLPFDNPDKLIKKLNKTLDLIRKPTEESLKNELNDNNNNPLTMRYREYIAKSKIPNIPKISKSLKQVEIKDIIQKATRSNKINADGLVSILSNKDGCLYYNYNIENGKFDDNFSEEMIGITCKDVLDSIPPKYKKTRELFTR